MQSLLSKPAFILQVFFLVIILGGLACFLGCDDTYEFEKETYLRFLNLIPNAGELDVIVALNNNQQFSDSQYIYLYVDYLETSGEGDVGTPLQDLSTPFFKTFEATALTELYVTHHVDPTVTNPWESVIGFIPDVNPSETLHPIENTYYTSLAMGMINPIEDTSENIYQNSKQFRTIASTGGTTDPTQAQLRFINASADVREFDIYDREDLSTTDPIISSEYATIPSTYLSVEPGQLSANRFGLSVTGTSIQFYEFPTDLETWVVEAGQRYLVLVVGVYHLYRHPEADPPTNVAEIMDQVEGKVILIQES
jgi:hypothetical protein